MRARSLTYAPAALADIAEIHAYLSARASASVADRVIARLRAAIRARREIPLLSPPRPEYGEHCRLLIAGSYAIYYNAAPSGMEVLRILHVARDRDSIMSGVQENAEPFAA